MGLVAMSAIGTAGFWYLDRKPAAPTKTIVQAVPSIVTVPITTPAAPAPIVNITVPPPPAPEVPMAPPPRALTPFLDAECIARTDSGEVEDRIARRCNWDAGFPAISADGKTIALKYSRDDGGRGWLNVAVMFIDAETSKTIGDHTIVAPDDLDENGQATDKTRARATKRVAAIQKKLDAGQYRTLHVIQNLVPEPDFPATAGLRIEHEQFDASVRVVDGDTNTVLWRGEFNAATEYPPRKVDPDTDTGCYPGSTSNVSAWFDPATKLIAFQVSYASGPCYCSDEIHHYVRRAATP